MRLRRSRALVVTFANATPVAHNFITRQSGWCPGPSFDLLCRANQWEAIGCLASAWPTLDPGLVSQWINYLVERSFLVVEGTDAAALDAEYERSWQWGEVAGFYHFALKDAPYMTAPQAAQWMEHRGRTAPAVPLYTTNSAYGHVIQLDSPDLQRGPLPAMAARRSVRTFLREPIPLAALRDCLFAGFGFTGFLDTGIVGSRELPLKMTPSGGGRNPYEAYVYVRRVEGVPAGIYHYSAAEHSLGLLDDAPSIAPADLLIGQHWADDCGAVVLLVANFDRTMWKYPNATAYRVVLLEAGHIAQNVALAAAAHGLNSTPTAAFSDTLAHRLLRLAWITQSLVYAILIGKGDPRSFEYRQFKPHSCRTADRASG